MIDQSASRSVGVSKEGTGTSMPWDDVHKSVNAVWIGFFNTAEFRDAATRLVDEISARNASHL
jgi:hypothetical protein